jgi:iron(III) transport system permease protein
MLPAVTDNSPPAPAPLLAAAAHRWPPRTTVAALLIAVAIAFPVFAVGASLFRPDHGAWSHIVDHTLTDLALNSAWLVVLVGAGAATIGTAMAWVTTRYDWVGRRTMEWMLVLPLAMPAYVMAYAYTDWLQYAGPVQTSLRAWFGWESKSDYWFFEMRSVGGAAAMLSLVLYPYVFLLARVAFLERSASLLEAGRTFGYGPRALFWRVSLPMARPAIAAGTALVVMETLADYGTVSYFGINTFTTGIFSAWFAQGDRIAAARLATLLVIVVVIALAIERRARRTARYTDAGNRAAAARGAGRIRLTGVSAWLAGAITLLPVLLGFALPVLLLLRLMLGGTDESINAQSGAEFLTLAWNSFSLGALTACLAVALGLVLAYAKRQAPGRLMHAANRIVGTGYAIPGTVVAVGVLIPITALDHQLANGISALTGERTGLILTGGISVLVYAYLVRFLAIALETCEAGFARITPSMDQAAISLGATSREVVQRVHLPLLRASLVTAGLMVFVDTMKELPATLVMRPFNFDTLAVRAYTFAKDERLAEASVAALAIVLVGLIPVVFASRAITAEQR